MGGRTLVGAYMAGGSKWMAAAVFPSTQMREGGRMGGRTWAHGRRQQVAGCRLLPQQLAPTESSLPARGGYDCIHDGR